MPRWLGVLVVLVVLAAVIAGLAVAGSLVTGLVQSWFAQPPGRGTVVQVAADTKAARAAQDAASDADERDAAQWLSEQPTAVWLTPEDAGVDDVAGRVADLAGQARAQGSTLAIVVYGLPGRDCGAGLSSGGLPDAAAYADWTGRIGQALRNASDVRQIVVLEPDSLALAPECGNLEQRATELRAAVERLSGTNTYLYLDGGHSNWRPAAEMAELIRSVGAGDRVRGFALNVSNYNATDDETAYAHELAAALGGGHAVIDTSRNGAGAGTTWCNPPGRLVGDAGGSVSDDVVDTNLWIKPPGESDGTCNGGPTAGTWWPTSAVQLTRQSR